MKKKIDAFAKSPFKDVDDYHRFIAIYRVYGAEAVELKKKLDRQTDLTPVLRPRKKK